MVKWTHEVSGTAIHPLSVNQSCTCAAHHVCQSCQGQDDRLRAVNAKLLAAAEKILVKWGRLHPDDRALLREAIEEAKK